MPTRRALLRASVAAGALSAAALAARAARARPGGGSSFRSSGSSSRSSSSSSSRSSSSSSRSSSGFSSSGSSSRSSGSSGGFGGPVFVPLPMGGGGGGDAGGAGGSVFAGLLLSVPGVVGLALASGLAGAVAARAGGRNEPIAPAQVGRALVAAPLLLAELAVLAVLAWPGRLVALAVLGLTVVALAQRARPVEIEGVGAAPAYDPAIDAAIAHLQAQDPGFSRVAFLDFVQALYADLHGRLGTEAFGTMRAFVADPVLRDLQLAFGPSRVDAVVVGLLAIDAVRLGPEGVAIDVTIESNYTRHTPGAPPVRWVVHEAWTLTRAAGGQSLEPARMRVLSCASCGAPADFTDAGACRYCGALVRRGEAQWMLAGRSVRHAETFSTTGLGETVPEAGTHLPTAFHPALTAQREAFAAAHGLAWVDFERAFLGQTVAPVFAQMYAAWSSKQWGDVRHLLGDRLWSSQRFWISAYDEKGYANKLDDLVVRGLEVVRIERDRHYESITVRVHAQCRDYTVDARGKVVGGDARNPRQFSEYWTFVRGAAARAPARGWAERASPSCGAAVDRMGEAGVCGYCGVKVTTGDFGWVLTLITQDEVYRG